LARAAKEVTRRLTAPKLREIIREELAAALKPLDIKVTTLEDTINIKATALENKIDSIRTELKTDIARVEQTLKSELARVEQTLSIRVESLEKRLDVIQRLAVLEAKLRELESQKQQTQ